MSAPRQKLTVTPLTVPQANACVTKWHRHHAKIPGGFAWFCIGVLDESRRLCGAAIAGRPTNRNNDDGQTVEVLRVATDGTPNACSKLLGACAKAAKAIGASRCITYTLDDEPGASLRGAGWGQEKAGIKSWWTAGTSRKGAVDRPHMKKTKSRWAVHFSNALPFDPNGVDAKWRTV